MQSLYARKFTMHAKHRLPNFLHNHMHRLSPGRFQNLLQKKLNAAPSARDHHALAVDGVPAQLGPSHFEMTPTAEGWAAGTNGGSRHTALSTHVSSTVSALRRQKAGHSAKENEARVLIGAQPRRGPVTSATTPITEVVVVATLGRSSHDLLLNRRKSTRVECASRKQRAALSAS